MGTFLLTAAGCRSSNSGSGGATPTSFPTEVAPRTTPDITVRATEYAFDAPTTLDAGLVSVTLSSDGKEPHLVSFARIIDGKTFRDVQAVASQNQDPSSMLEYFGGAGSVVPGGQQQVTIDLRPGTFVLLCPIRASDGQAHYAKGQIKQLEVTAQTGPASIPPRADTTVALKDFAFLAPTQTTTGRHVWKVANEGQDGHEMIIVKPAPGKTYDDVLAYFQAGATGPAPTENAGGFHRIDKGKSGWATIDLKPGVYALTCRITNNATGRNHAQLGMISQLEVK